MWIKEEVKSNLFFLDFNNSKWLMKKGNIIKKGETLDELFISLNSIKEKSYIICNDKFKELLKMFDKHNLVFRKDFKVIAKNEGFIQALTLVNKYNENIFIRNIKHFTEKSYKEELGVNLRDMSNDFTYLKVLLKAPDLEKEYTLVSYISKEFRQVMNFPKYYDNMITSDEFKYFMNWSYSSLYYLNDKYKNVVLENVKGYDINSYYWRIMCDIPLPYGKPIYNCDIENCNHKFSLVRAFVSAELKEGHVPFISKKGYKKNWMENNVWLENILEEELFLTNNTLDLMFEHYNVYNLEITDYICFETKVGLGKDKLKDWYKVKEQIVDKKIKSYFKNCVNRQFGKTAQRFTPKTFSYENGEIITHDKKERYYASYYPLFIAIRDQARVEMGTLANKYKENFISSVVDSINLINCDFKENISNQMGHFKEITYDKYTIFKSIGVKYTTNNKKDIIDDII